MFEKNLSDRLKRIFDVGKVSFDRPGESQEQEALFIDVENCSAKIVDGRQIAKVEGTIRVFADIKTMPYGFFAKRIAQASSNDTKAFFFGPEENAGTFRNITERKVDFTFLYDSQYDPDAGAITSVTLSTSEPEE